MSRDLPHLAARLFGTPLLIDARKLDAIVPAFMRRLNGEDDEPSGDSYRAPGQPQMAGAIAVIPVIGSLVRRKTAMDAWSGLTSYGDIAGCLDCCLDDARVKAILLQVDSYGGEATGCLELADRIFAARDQKPIWAVADVDALSAGYAILSQASRVLVAPSGSAGSIGRVPAATAAASQAAVTARSGCRAMSPTGTKRPMMGRKAHEDPRALIPRTAQVRSGKPEDLEFWRRVVALRFRRFRVYRGGDGHVIVNGTRMPNVHIEWLVP